MFFSSRRPFFGCSPHVPTHKVRWKGMSLIFRGIKGRRLHTSQATRSSHEAVCRSCLCSPFSQNSNESEFRLVSFVQYLQPPQYRVHTKRSSACFSFVHATYPPFCLPLWPRPDSSNTSLQLALFSGAPLEGTFTCARRLSTSCCADASQSTVGLRRWRASAVTRRAWQMGAKRVGLACASIALMLQQRWRPLC